MLAILHVISADDSSGPPSLANQLPVLYALLILICPIQIPVRHQFPAFPPPQTYLKCVNIIISCYTFRVDLFTAANTAESL